MKRLLFVIALLCSVVVGYAQVLEDVKPFGIPLGIDEETAFKILKEQGAVQIKSNLAPIENSYLYTLNEPVMGHIPKMLIMFVYQKQVVGLTLMFERKDYDSLLKACTEVYGEGERVDLSNLPAFVSEEEKAKMEQFYKKQLNWALSGTEEKTVVCVLNSIEPPVELEDLQSVMLMYAHKPLYDAMNAAKIAALKEKYEKGQKKD